MQWCGANAVAPSAFDCPLDATADELGAAVRSAVAPSDVDALVCAPQGFAGRSIGVLEQLGGHVGPAFGLASLSSDPTTELGNPRITAVDLAPWTFGRESVALLAAVLAGDPHDHLNRFATVGIRMAGEQTARPWGSLQA